MEEVDREDFNQFIENSKELARRFVDEIEGTEKRLAIPSLVLATGGVLYGFVQEGLFNGKEEAIQHFTDGVRSILADLEKEYGETRRGQH